MKGLVWPKPKMSLNALKASRDCWEKDYLPILLQKKGLKNVENDNESFHKSAVSWRFLTRKSCQILECFDVNFLL